MKVFGFSQKNPKKSKTKKKPRKKEKRPGYTLTKDPM